MQEALDNLDVKTLATHKERIAWIANHWLSLSASARDETLLFAPTHANREEITTFIRSGLKQEGTLKGEQFSQIILKTKMMEPIQSRLWPITRKAIWCVLTKVLKGIKFTLVVITR
ncbi:hypothetical protein PGH45_19245 [Legionella pneumophila]|nr:hypothetical protein [Legionella pneumophila]